MNEFPETRDSLLVQVKDPENRDAWEQFAQLYRPVIFRTAVARGLQDSDAHDLSQQVLIAVASAIGRWEKSDESSRFRNWLSRVTRNAILNALARRPRDQAIGGSSAQISLQDVAEEDEATAELLVLEYRRELYLRAAEVVRVDVTPDTWKAFQLTVIDEIDIEQAANQLGKPIGVIYSARSRVMFRLREVVRTLESQQ